MKSGFLLLNKPAGITSFDAIRIARKKLGIKKMGHAGTLDPFATGLLVVAVGEATKALSHLFTSSKTYRTQIVFGITSDTLDPEGKVCLATNANGIQEIRFSEEEIKKALSSFVGKILQTPPQYSALKIDGKRACDRMRAGETIKIKPRETELFSAELFGIEERELSEIAGKYSFQNILSPPNSPREVGRELAFWEAKFLLGRRCIIADIRIHVQTGFYVRSFARDLGKKLGTTAMCLSLHREKIGNFLCEHAISPDDISEKNIFPVMPQHFSLPSFSLSTSQREEFFHGQAFFASAEEKGRYAIFFENNWVGFAECDGKKMHPKKCVSSQKV